MRIFIRDDGALVIRLKDESAPYYDDYFHHNNEISRGIHRAWIYPYYSEKGELAEIVIYISPLYTPSFRESTDFHPEIEVPEKLPWRNYVFTFYSDFGIERHVQITSTNYTI